MYRRNRYFARNQLSRLCLSVLRTAADELLSTDDIAGRVIAPKGFDSGDAILRAAIREQVGAIVKRLGRQDAIESVGAGRVSKWKPTAIRTQQDGQNQHALMMELARGELPYGQFVHDSTRITVRMAVAIQPFIQE